MTEHSWHVGDVWPPVATVTNPHSGTPEKPVKAGTCVFTFQSPRGVETKPSVTESPEGVYTAEIKLTEAGVWKLNVTTTTPFEASQPAQIQVAPKFG